jgi:hypothetical protein
LSLRQLFAKDVVKTRNKAFGSLGNEGSTGKYWVAPKGLLVAVIVE